MISIIILSLVGLFSMIIGLFKPNIRIVIATVVIGILTAAALFTLGWNADLAYFNDMAYFDNFAIAMSVVLCTLTAMIIAVSGYHFADVKNYKTEHIALFVFSLIGMVTMVCFDHLSMLFVGIEIMSIPVYILAGSNRKSISSNESSVKYFLMGAFASGLLLMGITLIYGETSAFHVDSIQEYIANSASAKTSPLLAIGILLVLAGLLFKVSAVPFHFWTPDVYEGAPTLVTTFMGTAVKIAGLAAFYRLFYNCFLDVDFVWLQVLAAIIVLTISVGSISAVFQTNIKRLLAYSSISHAGFMLISILVASDWAGSTIVFYGVAYALASFVCFSVVMGVEYASGSVNIEVFNGLSKKNPLLALAMTVGTLSLAGIPLTAGFFAKFYILSSCMDGGYPWVALVAIVNAIIGIYYYFKVIIAMYFKETLQPFEVEASIGFKAILITCIALIFILGILPDSVYSLF